MGSRTYRVVFAGSTFLPRQDLLMNLRNHRLSIHNFCLCIRNFCLGICNHRLRIRDRHVGIDH